jgi:hypothetical protein
MAWGLSDSQTRGFNQYFSSHPGNISMDTNQAGNTLASQVITAHAKRPLLSLGVTQKVRGAQLAMNISKGYSKGLLAAGILDIGQNIRLAHSREYKRLGINLMGPPGSLFLYDNFMQSNKTNDDLEVIEQVSRRDPSLTSGSQTRGKSKSYKPKAGHNCAKGYRKINGMCVKQ